MQATSRSMDDAGARLRIVCFCVARPSSRNNSAAACSTCDVSTAGAGRPPRMAASLPALPPPLPPPPPNRGAAVPGADEPIALTKAARGTVPGASCKPSRCIATLARSPQCSSPPASRGAPGAARVVGDTADAAVAAACAKAAVTGTRTTTYSSATDGKQAPSATAAAGAPAAASAVRGSGCWDGDSTSE